MVSMSLVKPYYCYQHPNTNGPKHLKSSNFSSSPPSFLKFNRKFPLLVIKCSNNPETHQNNGDNNNKKPPEPSSSFGRFIKSKVKQFSDDPVKYMEIIFKGFNALMPHPILKKLFEFTYYVFKLVYLTSLKAVDDKGKPLLPEFLVPFPFLRQQPALPKIPQPTSTDAASASSTDFFFDVPASETKRRYKISVTEVIDDDVVV